MSPETRIRDFPERSGANARAVELAATAIALCALWGVSQSIWVLAPMLLREHHLVPRTVDEWLAVVAALLAVSTIVSLVLAMPVAMVAIVLHRLGSSSVRGQRAAALSPAALLPLAYIALSAWLERRFFLRDPPLHLIWSAAAVGAGFAIASGLLLGRLTSSNEPYPPRQMIRLLVASVVTGVSLLPFRIASTTPASSASDDIAQERLHRPVGATPPPLLFIGIDSGNWNALRPLMDSGRLPTLHRLVTAGAHGTLRAMWPPYWSGPAWAGILTGHPQDETNIYADLVVRAPGLPMFDAPLNGNAALNPFLLVEWQLLKREWISATPPPRAALRRSPVWETIAGAGLETAVLRFDFTYPPPPGTITVSNRAGRDSWNIAGVRASDPDAVSAPPDLIAPLRKIFSPERPPDQTLLRRVLASSTEPPGSHGKLEMEMLRSGLDIDQRTFEAAREILDHRPQLSFLAVYLGGFDNVCHAFWPYRFPAAYGEDAPAPDLIAAFGGVIDRYLEFLDAELEALLQRYGNVVPNVLIVSDHGHVATKDHPLWRGWHGPDGIVIASGPSFASGRDLGTASYFDVVPTILKTLGFVPPSGMHGVALD